MKSEEFRIALLCNAYYPEGERVRRSEGETVTVFNLPTFLPAQSAIPPSHLHSLNDKRRVKQ